MNETREMIMKAVEKADINSVLFLNSFHGNKYEEIISEAVKERDAAWKKEVAERGAELFGSDLIEGEGEEKEESFEDFARRIAHKIQSAGTKLWIQNLTKEAAESIAKGMYAAGNCNLILGNGEQIGVVELAKLAGKEDMIAF